MHCRLGSFQTAFWAISQRSCTVRVVNSITTHVEPHSKTKQGSFLAPIYVQPAERPRTSTYVAVRLRGSFFGAYSLRSVSYITSGPYNPWSYCDVVSSAPTQRIPERLKMFGEARKCASASENSQNAPLSFFYFVHAWNG